MTTSFIRPASALGPGREARTRSRHRQGGARHWMALCLILSWGLVGCGDGGEPRQDTRFGPVAAVQTWRSAVSAAIDEVNAVQAELELQAVGSSGQATGQNLATAAGSLRARLQAVADTLARIEPPAPLAPLQLAMLRLVAVRQHALELVVQGWEAEQARGFAQAQPLYQQAEAQFEAGRLLAVQVNTSLAEVDLDLSAAEGPRLVA